MAAARNLKPYFRVDKELSVVFLLISITGFVFFFVSNQRAFLNFFYLPVLISAYFFGSRHATQSAFFSIILISLVAFYYPSTFTFENDSNFYKWLDITTWGGFLIITGYFMGHLYEKKESANREIKKTYQGIIEMMSLIIDSTDKAAKSHSYKVSVISGMIARDMGLSEIWIENIRIAALLHDLEKLDVGSEVLTKLGNLPDHECENLQIRTTRGPDTLEPLCGKILDILPLILYHNERFDGSGKLGMFGENIPLGARIIAVADAFDNLASRSREERDSKHLNPKHEIAKNSGKHFDPRVVKALITVHSHFDSKPPRHIQSSQNEPAEKIR
jgi:HD-GYP domain-containing protein (c-di-GMP phosphodiesterase class II)